MSSSGGANLDPVYDIADTRHPPGHDACQSLGGQTRDRPIQSDNPLLYLDVDIAPCPLRNASRKLELATKAFADFQPLEGWLLYHGISHMHPDFAVAHPRGGLDMEAIDNSRDAWNGGDLFERKLLGRDARHLAVEDYRIVGFDS